MKMRAELATTLKQARGERGLSLEAAGGAANISQGYLHKLEAGRVNNPSPRVLRRLAAVLDVPYRRLMELADYVMPDDLPAAGPAPAAPPHPTSGPAAPPTFTGMTRELAAIRAELAELADGQRRLAEAVERLTEAGR